jgi:hypothetical protein
VVVRQARVDLLLRPEQHAVLEEEALLAVKVAPGNA